MFNVRIRGRRACFGRPEFAAERVSYETITPQAARGVLEAILWKPAIYWHIHRIDVLAPVRWFSMKRNEVQSVAHPRAPYLVATDPSERAQRNTLGLLDVDYVVTASFSMTARAGERDNPAKFAEMFARRLERGQHFTAPYLGCREFEAHVEFAPERYETIPDTKPLGLIPWGLELVGERWVPRFFPAMMRHGSIDVPSLAEARRFVQENGAVTC